MTPQNSQMRRQQLANTLSDRLSTLWGIIRSRNQRGLTDANLALEDIMMLVMNALFDWELINLNGTHLNYPAVDLGDIKRRKAVQVTSNSGSAKLKETYVTAINNKLINDFSELYVFVLSPTKTKLKLTLDPNAPGVTVWNIADLVTEVMRRRVGVQALLLAIDVLDQEIAPGPRAPTTAERKTTPVASACFQLHDGEPITAGNDKDPSYGVELWFDQVPPTTTKVTVELMDRSIDKEDRIWSVKRRKGTRDFLTDSDDFNLYGDVGIRAKGEAGGKKIWTIETSLFEAIERYYRTFPIDKKLLTAYTRIRDN